MKKTLSLILALITLLFCLVGCDNSKDIVLTDEDIHTDYAGVYLTLSSVDGSGEHKKLNAVWHNETTKTVTYGNWFVIEMKDGENWTEVSTADVSFTEEAYVVKPNKTSEKSYTTKFADISQEGTYRVRTEFYVQESNETSKRGTTWIEFEVKPAGSVKSYSVTVENGDEYLYENLNRKYKAGEQVVIKTHTILDMSLTVYVNGESIGTGAAIKTGDEYTHWEYYFTMPSEDVTITFEEKDGMLVDNYLRHLSGCEWLNKLSAEDIAEIKIISEAVGVAPGNLKNISGSTDEAVIARIFEEYYWLDTAPISKMDGQIDGGSGVTVKFILKDGTANELYINNGNYRDTNGDYFELNSVPKFADTDNAVKAYGFINYIATGTVYDKDNDPVCEIPMDELVFIITDYDSGLFANGYNCYVDTEFGKLYFVKVDIFATDECGSELVGTDYYFMEEGNTEVCYRLVGKNLDELIAEYSATPTE